MSSLWAWYITSCKFSGKARIRVVAHPHSSAPILCISAMRKYTLRSSRRSSYASPKRRRHRAADHAGAQVECWRIGVSLRGPRSRATSSGRLLGCSWIIKSFPVTAIASMQRFATCVRYIFTLNVTWNVPKMYARARQKSRTYTRCCDTPFGRSKSQAAVSRSGLSEPVWDPWKGQPKKKNS